ncbi:MAG: 3'-5' exonuclease domain-containing protein 2 [Salinivirgaceae bacterium]|jgi:ribonuclease D|nr:3'-5' exonuclease domain-containing protein 2 [Salinivirgaceae bacterium]
MQTIDNETLNELPKGEFQGTIKVITTPEGVNQVIPEIIINDILGFDTETKPAFKKGKSHEISLLQLSNDETAWLFRLHLCGFTPPLVKLMADPSIRKIGAAILDDIRGLKKLTPFKDGGFIDLQKHVADYGVQEKGVKKMAAIFLGQKISKRQRLTNWENPELTEPQLRYAATDAWVCLKIHEKMLSIKKQ